MATPRKKRKRRDRRLAWWAGGAAILIAIGVALAFLPAKEMLSTVIGTVDSMGPWGPVVFGGLYALAVVTLLPAAPMTLIAGIIYGAWAIPLVMIAAMIGALVAFLIARFLLRKRVKRYLQARGRLQAVDKAIGAEGWKVVTLLRLSPLVPFNVQNYVLGASKISFGTYAVSTFLGMIPGTLVFVYLGAAGKATISSKDAGALQWSLFVVGIVASVAVAWMITRKAKERLKQL